MVSNCCICKNQIFKTGVTVKDGSVLCQNCAKSLQRMLGDPVPVKEFTATELNYFIADPSTCPSTIPYYKKLNPDGCCVCGRSDIFIERTTRDGKPLCKDCVQNYVTVSGDYYVDPAGFASKHDSAYFAEVFKDCVRPRHDIIFNFTTHKLFIMQTNNNSAYRLLNFEDVEFIDNGFQRYDISSDEKGRPLINASVKGQSIDLSESPAMTVIKPGSGFRYEAERGRRNLKVRLRYRKEYFYYVIDDSTDMSYAYDKTFGLFLRLVRALKEKADLSIQEEIKEMERKEAERQLCIQVEEEQKAIREQLQKEEEKRKEEEKKKSDESKKPDNIIRPMGKGNVMDLIRQRDSMRFVPPKADKEQSDNNDFSALIDLRKLLDAGIITEEEFSAKKKQILGI